MIHPDRREHWHGARLLGTWFLLIVIPAALCTWALYLVLGGGK